MSVFCLALEEGEHCRQRPQKCMCPPTTTTTSSPVRNSRRDRRIARAAAGGAAAAYTYLPAGPSLQYLFCVLCHRDRDGQFNEVVYVQDLYVAALVLKSSESTMSSKPPSRAAPSSHQRHQRHKSSSH